MHLFRYSTGGSLRILLTLFLPLLGEFLSRSHGCFISIFFIVRRHRVQLQALQVRQVAQNDEEMVHIARLRGSAVGTFYLYLLALLCNLPQFCSFAVVANSEFSTGIKVFDISSGNLITGPQNQSKAP